MILVYQEEYYLPGTLVGVSVFYLPGGGFDEGRLLLLCLVFVTSLRSLAPGRCQSLLIFRPILEITDREVHPQLQAPRGRASSALGF